MFLLGPSELKCAGKTDKITNIYNITKVYMKTKKSVIKTFFEDKVEILFLLFLLAQKVT